MTDPEALRIIAGWLNNLAELTRHGEEGRPTKNKLAVTATMLGQDFPSSAFTTDSLHAVVQGAEWFPPYDTIRQRVAEWWQDHRPACARALAGPYAAAATATDLTGRDRGWLDYFATRNIEGFGPPRDGCPPSSRSRCLHLIKCQSPAAYSIITGAAPEPEWSAPTAAEKSAVAAALRSVRGREAA